MHNRKKAILYGLATVMLWSTVASAFKLSLRYLDPIQLLFYGSIFSTLVLGAILAAQGKMHLLFACSGRQILRSVILGLLNPLLYYLVLFKAYDLLPAQEAQPLNYTWAITLALLSVPLLKQKIRWKNVAALLVGYSGVVVISTHGDPLSLRFSSPLGVCLALGSTVIWSLYWIYNTKDDRDPVAGLFLNFLCSLPFVTVLCLSFSSVQVSDSMGLWGAAYVGIFEMGLTFVLWLYALKFSQNTARVGSLIFLSPFLSLVFIHYFVGEEILPSTYIGLILIIGGLLLQHTREAPHRE